MDGDHPYKRVKYAFSASKSAVDLAISDGTKKSKEDVVDCLRVVLDSGTELLESLKEGICCRHCFFFLFFSVIVS